MQHQGFLDSMDKKDMVHAEGSVRDCDAKTLMA